MIWLFPLKDKSSLEVATALKTWIAWYSQPFRFYCDNGTEFKGDVDDLLARRSPPIETLLLRLYVAAHTTLRPRVVLRRPMMYSSSDWLPYAKRNAFHVPGFPCFLNFKK
jgi:hypothetical protein